MEATWRYRQKNRWGK